MAWPLLFAAEGFELCCAGSAGEIALDSERGRNCDVSDTHGIAISTGLEIAIGGKSCKGAVWTRNACGEDTAWTTTTISG
jgi:hypothetical protein